MAIAQLGAVVSHIRSLALVREINEQTDGALVRAFLQGNDQAAFEALVRRHGPMVLQVCRRTLGNDHDAEDAFQAAFLILARRATSIRKKESLTSWLHGVAYRMATHAKRAAARRHKHESQANPTPPRDPAFCAAWQEIQILLDDEIQRLPEVLREPFICCCLQNKSCAEAARQFGLNEGTVAMRLSRARKLLQKRLTRHGVALTTVLAAAAVGASDALAVVPRSLVVCTAKAATLIAAGQAAVDGVISAKVADLTQGVLKTICLTKMKTTTTALLIAGLLFSGLLVSGGLSADPFALPHSRQAQRAAGQDQGKAPDQGPATTKLLALAAASGVLNLPPAPPGKFTFVDLQGQTNQKLKDNFGNGGNGNNLADLGEGGRPLAGINFKIGEGAIRLGSKVLQKDKEKPTKVEGIKVGKKCVKLHILHATEFAGNGNEGDAFFVADGIRIAEYKVQYADGSTETIPMVNGEDVRDWWFADGAKGVTRGQVAWKGNNELAKEYNMGIRLYMTTWENPHPAKAIASIDFIKIGESTAAPFCVAITLETK
jgi:RNA polymerase sigma factor (sigma-70 family)